jgi:hypothetical protein
MSLEFICMDLARVKSARDADEKIRLLTEVVEKLIREMQERERRTGPHSGFGG